MMRMTAIVALAGLAAVGAGCGPQSYPVAYPEAARAVAELYPPGGADMAGKKPAYGSEMGIGQFDISVTAKEVAPGQEFRVQIDKNWKYTAPRRTSIIVQKADNGVLVTVRSERQMIPKKEVWMRDMMFEAMRQNEIRSALKGSRTPSTP